MPKYRLTHGKFHTVKDKKRYIARPGDIIDIPEASAARISDMLEGPLEVKAEEAAKAVKAPAKNEPKTEAKEAEDKKS